MLQQDTISSQYYIHSFEQDTFKILCSQNKEQNDEQDNKRSYSTTLLISQDSLKTENLAHSFNELNITILDAVKDELKIEILLVGTGKNQKFPPVDLLKKTIDYPFSVDFMTTGAACRTFNILANENRRVAALLFTN